jgi:hypothetical protein
MSTTSHVAELPASTSGPTTSGRWASGYDRLPDCVNEALSRIAELYYGYRGYDIGLRRQLSGKLMMHVNGILCMDVVKREAWHQDNLRLIAEVEKTASKS